jgi:hypothetical protein
MGGKTGHAIRLIGCDAVQFETVRASLRRSPFHFLSEDAPREESADLLVAPADLVQRISGVPGTHPPIIAFGPARLLRSAFLAGCADYLKDPWTPEELALRALAVFSRVRAALLFPWGELAFEGNTLTTPIGPVDLTRHEALLLRALLWSRGTPVSREALAYSLWGKPGGERSRAIDAHISAIRGKIAAVLPDKGRRFIVAVRSQGYMVP